MLSYMRKKCQLRLSSMVVKQTIIDIKLHSAKVHATGACSYDSVLEDECNDRLVFSSFCADHAFQSLRFHF